jgi:type IV pilus biogenesis protein CpaD/CtpE
MKVIILLLILVAAGCTQEASTDTANRPVEYNEWVVIEESDSGFLDTVQRIKVADRP